MTLGTSLAIHRSGPAKIQGLSRDRILNRKDSSVTAPGFRWSSEEGVRGLGRRYPPNYLRDSGSLLVLSFISFQTLSSISC